jgi:ABC-type transport system involved in multi-copper enzyme maturation permease subunit
MSEIVRETATIRPAASGLPWALWRRQVAAIVRLELRKRYLTRSSIGLLLLALAPLVILGFRAMSGNLRLVDPANLAQATDFYAGLYQGLILRIVVFLGCVSIFGTLIRREVLERSLHYYFLSPVRREVLVAAKFLTGLLVSVVLFDLATIAAFLMAYAPHNDAERFLLHGPGLGHLGAYLLSTTLGCVGYGAVFLVMGFFFRSPAIPALMVFGWEGIYFLLPPLLKGLSVVHYLQALCPVPISEGPLAILSDAPPPWVAIPGLLLFATALLALSAWKVRKMEVKYEED